MSKSFILADSGSTKTLWSVIREGILIQDFVSSGMNPYVNSEAALSSVFELEVYQQVKDISDLPIFFYGAGCTEIENIQKMQRVFKKVDSQNVFIGHDLLAAGRAMYGDKAGIACILGTGSSSALFDKGEIIDQVPALGYVLGDEGAGVDLGRRLLVAILKRGAPDEINRAFVDKYGIGKKEVLEHVFFGDRPNKYLASFAPFLLENQENTFIKALIYDSFATFVKLNVLKYHAHGELPIGFIGSVAHHFKPILSEVLQDFELQLGPVIQSPMEGLIQYHLRSLS